MRSRRRITLAEYPIIPSKTAMLFFDTLDAYLHPEDPARQAAIKASGVIDGMVKINQACHEAGIAVFFGQADHRLDRKDFAPLIIDRGYDGKPGCDMGRSGAGPLSAGLYLCALALLVLRPRRRTGNRADQ